MVLPFLPVADGRCQVDGECQLIAGAPVLSLHFFLFLFFFFIVRGDRGQEDSS